MAMFNSYVKLPEGKFGVSLNWRDPPNISYLPYSWLLDSYDAEKGVSYIWVPPVLIHLNRIVQQRNHPAIGVPTF